MLNTLKSLPEDPAELRTVSELLMAEVQSQAYLIEKLKGQLAAHQKARFGSKSESLDQLAFDLSEDAEIEAAAEAQKQRDPAHDDDTETDQPAKRKHSRNPLPDHLDRVERSCPQVMRVRTVAAICASLVKISPKSWNIFRGASWCVGLYARAWHAAAVRHSRKHRCPRDL